MPPPFTMSSTNIDTSCPGTSLPDCHWELCRRFMARYQHLFREGQVATLAHFFANTQLLMRGLGDQIRQLVCELVPDQADVEREMGTVEKQIKKEPEPESVPTEVAIESEPQKEETSEVTIKHEPNHIEPPGIFACEKSSESIIVPAVETEPLSSVIQSVIPSICSSPRPSTLKAPEEEQPKPGSDAAIVAKLAYFKPFQRICSIEDLYRNLVIFDSDFDKTSAELERLQSGSLLVTGYEMPNGQYRGLVCLGELLLAEAWDIDLLQAKEKAKKEFLRNMKVFCFQIVSKKLRLPAMQIARLVDPETNIEYYKSIIKKFTEDTTQRELIFCEEFSQNELNILEWIASGLNLEANYVRRSQMRQLLTVRARTVPALAILERILIDEDRELSALYAVFPPRGSR